MIHATISGNIGRDPELRSAGSGEVLSFSVASNTREKRDSGWEKTTTWVRCSMFRRAGALARILERGSYVTVRGQLTLREYPKRDGTTGYGLELRADEVELGPKRDNSRATPPHQNKDRHPDYESVRRDNIVEKCIFCDHRLKNNELPACVEACPSGARVIGDVADGNSEVSKLLKHYEHFVLKPEDGTKPNVYYIRSYSAR